MGWDAAVPQELAVAEKELVQRLEVALVEVLVELEDQGKILAFPSGGRK